ncbi:MAG TPA: hypothetical protein VKB77_13025 [Terriglobales bacterium]|nr:hypothetical protein [Terriglobales bacterium]
MKELAIAIFFYEWLMMLRGMNAGFSLATPGTRPDADRCLGGNP